MKKEIQQGKCLPTIETEADFESASERGYSAASGYLKQSSKSLSERTVEDLTKLHGLYFHELYSHAGKLRHQGDLAAFGGRVGADSKNIRAELDLLLKQARIFEKGLDDVNSPTGLSDRLNLIAFVHARLVLIHPFKDGNGRWARLITSAMEKELLPNHETTNSVPRPVYMHALKALPNNLGPLMNYHAERLGLYPSTLRSVPPLVPVHVTNRD